MDNLFDIDRTAAVASVTPWAYRGTGRPEIVELATVTGSPVALPAHFHAEDQITFVLSGRRRFRVGLALVEVHAGRGAFIEAGTIHSSLPEPDPVVCFNAYLTAGRSALPRLVAEVARLWRRHDPLSMRDLAALVRATQPAPPMRVGLVAAPSDIGVDTTIADVARRAGFSREGFSRTFRKTHGIPPVVFRSLSRLNDARSLLRAGIPPAAVAAEAGFADQSHLGRCFRHAFGVTPGRYRDGLTRSHLFQTGSCPGL